MDRGELLALDKETPVELIVRLHERAAELEAERGRPPKTPGNRQLVGPAIDRVQADQLRAELLPPIVQPCVIARSACRRIIKRMSARRLVLALLAPALVLLSVSPFPRQVAGAVSSVTSAGFTVDDAADRPDARPGDGTCATSNGRCTLRAAIMEANAAPGPITITMPAGTFKIGIEGAREDGAAAGDFDLTGDLALVGAGAGETFIQGAGEDRVFDVHPSARVTISGVRIRRGTVWDEHGAGIRSAGYLTLIRASVSSNKAFDGAGGGIYTVPGSTTTLIDTTVWHNKATDEGRGDRGDGGGIFNGGELSLINVTVTNNQAVGGTGGGILNRGTVTATNSTFSTNSASKQGGGIANESGLVPLKNVILANSRAGGDCAGTLTSGGHNLIEDPTGCGLVGDLSGNLLGRDPRLGELVEDGPYAGSRDLRPGSPAIDAGADDGCPPADQHGAPRPRDGDGDGQARCDIGAIERQ